MPTRTVDHAVVLAAGRGTRMGSLTEEIPKPMIPVAGRPLLEHIVEALRSEGVARFSFVTGYLAEKIEDHFGDGARFGVSIEYARQEVRDGTARALLLGRGPVGDHPFVLAWGDILTARPNYRRLIARFHEGEPAGVLCVQRVDDPYRGAAVTTDEEGRVLSIVEKPPKGSSKTPWVNAGLGVFEAELFDRCAAVEPSPRGEYEIPDAVRAMIDAGRDLRILELEGFWTDVGTPEDLARVEEILAPAPPRA